MLLLVHRKEKSIMRLGIILLLALCVSLLGWRGWAMVAIGIVLYILTAILWEHINDRFAFTADKKFRKRLQEEEEQEWQQILARIKEKEEQQ